MKPSVCVVLCLGLAVSMAVQALAQGAPSYVRDPIRIEARVYDLTEVPASASESAAPWSIARNLERGGAVGSAWSGDFGFDPSGCLEAALLTLPGIRLVAGASATGYVGREAHIEVDGPGIPAEVAFVTAKAAGNHVVVRHPIDPPAVVTILSRRSGAGETEVNLTLAASVVAGRDATEGTAIQENLAPPVVHEHWLASSTRTRDGEATFIACLSGTGAQRPWAPGEMTPSTPPEAPPANGLASTVVVVRISGLIAEGTAPARSSAALPGVREAETALVARLAELSALASARALPSDDALRLAALAAKSPSRDEGEEAAYRGLLARVRDGRSLLQRMRLTGVDGLTGDERQRSAELDARDQAPDSPVVERLGVLAAEIARLQDSLRTSLGDVGLHVGQALRGHGIRETFGPSSPTGAGATVHFPPLRRPMAPILGSGAGVAEPGLATYELGRSAALTERVGRLAQELKERVGELSGEEATRLLDELQEATEEIRESLGAAKDALLPTPAAPLQAPGSPRWELWPPEGTREPFVGIGAAVGMGRHALGERERPIVRNVLPGGPAAEAGLRLGDAIVAVDGQEVDDTPLDELVDRIRGEEGTEVSITVERTGPDGTTEKVELKMTRAKVSFGG